MKRSRFTEHQIIRILKELERVDLVEGKQPLVWIRTIKAGRTEIKITCGEKVCEANDETSLLRNRIAPRKKADKRW